MYTYLLLGQKEVRQIRVAAKIFGFVFSRKFREIISFTFPENFLEFRKIFAKHESEICAKFEDNFAKRETLNNLNVAF